MEFEVGDVVEYHTDQYSWALLNGAIGVIISIVPEALNSEYKYNINWLTDMASRINSKSECTIEEANRGWHGSVLTKIGHIDLPPDF